MVVRRDGVGEWAKWKKEAKRYEIPVVKYIMECNVQNGDCG